MKKIIATIALAVVSIVIGITAFASANASSSFTAEQERYIAVMAGSANISVKEMKNAIAWADKSCDLGYDIDNGLALDQEKQDVCTQLEDLNLI